MEERIQALLEQIKSISQTEIDFKSGQKIPPEIDKFFYNENKNNVKEHYIYYIDEILSNEALSFLERSLPRFVIQRYSANFSYAYQVVSPITYNNKPSIHIKFLSLTNDYQRFEELINQYSKVVENYNAMAFENIQYAIWLTKQKIHNRIIELAKRFYNKIKDYIEVVPDLQNNIIIVYTASQLKGYCIGRQGSTVKQLERILMGELNNSELKVRVETSEQLTEKYFAENPDDPETVQIITKVAELLSELEEKYGIKPESVLRIIKTFKEKNDEYKINEEDTQEYSFSNDDKKRSENDERNG